MARLALLGGGGYAKEVREVAELCGFVVEDYFADRQGQLPLRYRGYLDELMHAYDEFDGIALAIGGIDRRSMAARNMLVAWLKTNGFICPPLISPHAVCSARATVEAGGYVAHGAVISSHARVGAFSQVNINAVIGHDAVLQENVNVSPLAFVGGGAKIGSGTMVGAGARILQAMEIGRDVSIGMGCTIISNITDGDTILPAIGRLQRGG